MAILLFPIAVDFVDEDASKSAGIAFSLVVVTAANCGDFLSVNGKTALGPDFISFEGIDADDGSGEDGPFFALPAPVILSLEGSAGTEEPLEGSPTVVVGKTSSVGALRPASAKASTDGLGGGGGGGATGGILSTLFFGTESNPSDPPVGNCFTLNSVSRNNFFIAFVIVISSKK